MFIPNPYEGFSMYVLTWVDIYMTPYRGALRSRVSSLCAQIFLYFSQWLSAGLDRKVGMDIILHEIRF